MSRANLSAQLELALAYHRASRFADAASICNGIIAVQPDNFDATYLLAMLQAQQGAIPLAVEMFRRAVRLNPRAVDAHYNLALAMNLTGDHENALKHYRRVLKLDPTHIDANNNYAGTLAKLGRFHDAVAQYRNLLARKPDHAEGYCNLSVLLTELDRPEDAVESAERAISIYPNYAEAHFTCAIALAEIGRVDEALASYDRAIALKPDYAEAHRNRYLLQLLKGDYDRGWPEMQWRKKIISPHMSRVDKPVWLGDADIANKRLLVHWEQGLGDTIQFSRFIPLLQKMNASILFMPQRSLRALVSGLASEIQLVNDGDPLPDFDYHCPLMSLPLAFKTTVETIPRNVPYLFAERQRVEKWRNVIGEHGFKVGIAWHSNVAGKEIRKSVPLSQFECLSKLPDVRLISLQKNEGSAQVGKHLSGVKVDSLGESFDAGEDAFIDTAAVMKSLDLVITIDTSVAHLAGALGVPTWVALKQVPDWRWLMDRADSPWYPTVRLFRQPARDDWDSVFRSIQEVLTEHLASHCGRSDADR